METAVVYGVIAGIMEKKMETTIVYGVIVGIIEKKMETTIHHVLHGKLSWSKIFTKQPAGIATPARLSNPDPESPRPTLSL